uniref:RING-type domain-containing protein n=1 Tax=Arcella intermedia TaxID=1963864 RepID=A0A6B2LWW0_9EUKA
MEREGKLEEAYQVMKETMKKMESYMQEKQACVVCLTDKKAMVFVPCGHMSCCVNCSGRVSTCPVCRAAISQKVKVFH